MRNIFVNKLVSIIMPSYNTELYIKKAILSVINQTYKNWELIIVDDCSSDNTDLIVKIIELNILKIVKIQVRLFQEIKH